jgi:citrate lyase subunit beta / citryl-CoA lyase
MSAPLASVRSLLFAPGNEERKLRGALASEADAVIADLEDGVAASQRDRAREVVREVLGEGDAPSGGPPAAGDEPGGNRSPALDRAPREPGPLRLLRIAEPGDLALAAELGVDAVMVPKATAATVRDLPAAPPVVAIVETPAGVREAHAIASSPAVAALMLGAVDLSAALGLEPYGDGLELLFARSALAVDSAAAGIGRPIDSPCLDFKDLDVVRHEAERARALGFAGKACIHPAQVTVVNAAFTPSAEQVEWAESTLAALAEGEREGRGAVALAGTMIDEPVAARARGILARTRRDGA